MDKTIAQLGYDNFNIAGEVREELPPAYDFELYVENNTIRTKGYNVLTNRNVAVENGAMKFLGGVDSYLTLDPEILNGVVDFELEIKFKPTSKDTEISGIFHADRIPDADKSAGNEFGINIKWNRGMLYADMWNLDYGSTESDFFDNPLTLPLSFYGDINVIDDYTTLKIVRKNGFLVSYVNDVFKKGYRSIGTFKIDVVVVGCENDVGSASSLINLDATQAFTGYIEYIKIKNYKTPDSNDTSSINYNNFSIQPSGDIYATSLTEGYKDLASSRSLYYLPNALKTEDNSLSAIGDLSSYKTVDGGTMVGNIKPTDVIDLMRSPSKNAIKMTAQNYPSVNWDWNLHKDAYYMSSWSNGYNAGVTNSNIGYHAKFVKEGPDGGMCIKFIDMNTAFGVPHRWLGMSRDIANGTIPFTVGDKLTVHFKAKSSRKDSTMRFGFYRLQLSTNTRAFGPNSKTIPLTDNWEEYAVSFTVDNDWNLNDYATLYFYGDSAGADKILWVSDIIISRNLDTNMTSEQLYNLSDKAIKFNLSRDIGLDWSKPWTICYWKKPLNETSNKYNLDSLGSNPSKNAGRGYMYIGSNNDQNTLIVRLDEGKTAHRIMSNKNTDYFGNWIFTAIRYDGTNLYACIRGEKIDDLIYSANVVTPLTSNFFDSTFGYDLSLGGFDNIYNAASLFKDLLIAKNAVISDADLDYIYRTKINYNNGALTSNANFKETL